ncbi:DUF6088 family protein [Convivina intestini]|uniref:DUF6088 family protein n=1 Tax=Convivina intestini TaxID=1505726 RepID=UPI0020109662|nr:DUF6088 family protein [Convivina intestini]CAH1856982.1 hypothetical protein R078131_01509 [Convivina intestini]
MTVSSSEKIRNRIKRNSQGAFFILNDFLDIANRDVAKKEVNRLVREDVLGRVYSGIYQKKKINKLFNREVPPSHHQIILQIARKNNQQIVPAGNTALNLVGLSTQIPTISEYITNGPSRKIQFPSGPPAIFRHSGTKKFFANPEVNLMLEILTYLDEKDITENTLKILGKRLSVSDFNDLKKAANKSTNKLRAYVLMLGNYVNND